MRIVVAGQQGIDRFAASTSAAFTSLTARQAEVLRLAGRGLSDKQIAAAWEFPLVPSKITSARCGGVPRRAAEAS